MKRMLALLMVSALFCGCGGKQVENSLTERNLKGKVKSLRTKSYRAVDNSGEIEKGELSNGENSKSVFNEAGFITEYTIYAPNGGMVSKFVYKYDDDNKQTEGLNYTADGLNTRTVYEYEDGLQTRIALYSADSLMSVTEIENADSRPVKFTIWGGAGEPIATRTQKWENGKVVEETFEDAATGMKSSVTHTISGGQVVSRKEARGQDHATYTFKYDPKNNPVAMTYSNSKGVEDGISVEYKYDATGNWTEQVIFSSGTRQPMEIAERVYEYYE